MLLQGTQGTLREPCLLKPMVICTSGEKKSYWEEMSSVRSLGNISSYLFLLKEYYLQCGFCSLFLTVPYNVCVPQD